MTRAQAWRSVIEAYQTCAAKYNKLMAQFELTSSQYDVLFVIENLGEDATPKRIAAGLLVTMGNVTSVTRRLLERELIKQSASKTDRRSIRFSLTKSGLELLAQAKFASKQFVDDQLGPFSEQEVQFVGELMQRMRTHLDSEAFDTSLHQIIRSSGTSHD
jgi:DNA-binding MarR family transcriptional regulator